MSKSFTAPNADLDTTTSNAIADEGKSRAAARYQTVLQLLNNTPKFTAEWFRLKEEEVQLRSHPDIKESICTGHVVDSIAGDVGDIHAGEANVTKISTLECNTRIRRSSSGRFPSDSIHSPQVAIIGADDPKNDNLNVIAGDLPGPLFAGSTLNKSDSPNANEGNDAVKVSGHITSPSVQVLHDCDFEDEIEPPHANAGIDIKEAINTLPTIVDELSPVPFSLGNYGSADGPKPKGNAAINTLRSMNDEGPSPPLSICFANAAITEKLSRVDAPTAIKSAQPTSSAGQTPTTVKSIYTNQGQVPNEDIVPQSRSMHPEVGINYGLFSSPPVSQTDVTHPRACANVLSQSVPNESVHEEEGREDAIVIPEAFLVEANAPVEVRDVGVADLVEPDQSTFPMKKCHACVVSILFAVIVVALGTSFYFTRLKTASNAIPETTLMLSPSLQPTFQLPSSQPSFFQPSLSIKSVIEKNILQRNVTFDAMEDTNVRVMALEWINNKDGMELVASDSNLFQRYILVLLAYESNMDWLSDVNSNVSECKWLGVECDKDGHVIKLELSNYSLEGTMPPEMGSLQFLQLLSMSGNVLSGTLPYELGNLKNVSELYLSANNFTGTIPSEIGNLKKITALNFNTNEFTGTLPSGLWNLNKLISLSLESNQFYGTLPSEVGNLIELTSLDLRMNRFSGALPPELGNLNKLTELYVNGNLFSDSLPSELANLSNLSKLDLSSNNFMGPLPSELGKLNMLTSLDLVFNQFTGTLPSELGNLKNLTLLQLYYNLFMGTLPSELGNLQKMTDLEVSVNRFNGTLPTEIGNLKELRKVRFNENRFTGTLPTELGELKMLDQLYLFSNRFSGTIPSELGQLTSLTYFSIYSNQFIGALPSWIGDFTELYQLYVGGNQFTGTLPSELGLLKELTYFGIEDNKFNGTLPSWIGDFRDLNLLWLQNNQFTGTFPLDIGNFSYLIDFCLNDNNFSGSLPRELEGAWSCT